MYLHLQCEPKDDSKYKPTQCNKTQVLECWCVTPSTNEGITKPRLVQRESDLDCGKNYLIYLTY